MNVAFKVETLYAGFDNPHHVLVMGVPAVGVPNEAGMQNIGTTRSLARGRTGSTRTPQRSLGSSSFNLSVSPGCA